MHENEHHSHTRNKKMKPSNMSVLVVLTLQMRKIQTSITGTAGIGSKQEGLRFLDRNRGTQGVGSFWIWWAAGWSLSGELRSTSWTKAWKSINLQLSGDNFRREKHQSKDLKAGDFLSQQRLSPGGGLFLWIYPALIFAELVWRAE